MPAALAAEARLLVAAERRGRVEPVERVGPDHAGAQLAAPSQRMREPFSVQMPADSPYGVLFAFSTASSGVRNVSTESTGPKISSRAMRCAGETSVKNVGGNQKPRSGSSHGGDQRSAPSASPASRQLADARELLGRVDRADVGVLVERVAEPQRRHAASAARRSTSSATDSCTSSREPAQQTWPWLKKMPLTMPSTAWSSGASSKTMLAALPPSSSVSRLPRAGDAALDHLADLGRAGERDLVDAGVLDERLPDRTGRR